MGADLSAGSWREANHRELNRSSTAALAVSMTSPWYVPERDGSEVGYDSYQQDWVDVTSFQAADYEIPWTLEGYFEWARQKFPESNEELLRMSWGRPINREIFDAARDFVHHCAVHGLRAYYSY
jgi:hypothetical protein